MAILAAETKELGFHLEQVQDFTPTPMTVATEIFYSGFHPYTLQPVVVVKSEKEKKAQNKFFFWYQKENHDWIREKLREIKRPDLTKRLLGEEPKKEGKVPKWLAEKRKIQQSKSKQKGNRR
jgi:radical SAM superfamily enzyme YgiQ (UPF0313 family)